MGQAPIKIKTGNALDVGDTTANVATNKAELAALAANIDGKDSYPQSVSTQRLSVAEAMVVDGGSITLGDGVIHANHLVQTESVITQTLQVGNNVITEDAINVPNLSAINANLGSISSGSIAVGLGGVAIGSSSAGIGIMGNQIFCKSGGATTILIDGATGVVTASKFQLTADEDSSLDMTAGSLTIGGGTSVDGTTTVGDIATDASQAASDASAALGAAADALEVADGEIVGYYQTTAPASGMKFGDIWIDTDYAGFPTVNAIFRYQDTSGGSSGALAWRAAPNNAIGKVYLNAYSASVSANNAQSTANSKITTFYTSSTPTALATGDLWVNTGQGNKLYRAGAPGIYDWTAVQDAGAAAGASAIQPGNGVAVDGSKYITRIVPASGLTISTAGSESGARTNITGNGMAIYKSTSTIVVQVDHTNGVWVNNVITDNDPSVIERYSWANSGTEKGWLASAFLQDYGIVTRLVSKSGDIHLEAPAGSDVVLWGDWVNLPSASLSIGGHIAQVGTGTYNTFAERIDCAELIEAKHFKLDSNDGKIYFHNGTVYSLYVDSDGDLIYTHAGGSVTIASGT